MEDPVQDAVSRAGAMSVLLATILTASVRAMLVWDSWRIGP